MAEQTWAELRRGEGMDGVAASLLAALRAGRRARLDGMAWAAFHDGAHADEADAEDALALAADGAHDGTLPATFAGDGVEIVFGRAEGDRVVALLLVGDPVHAVVDGMDVALLPGVEVGVVGLDGAPAEVVVRTGGSGRRLRRIDP